MDNAQAWNRACLNPVVAGDRPVPLLAEADGRKTSRIASAGRLLGYYEPHINSWDCLAGIALVREAGGWCNDFLAGGGLVKGNPIVVAAPGVAHLMQEVSGITR